MCQGREEQFYLIRDDEAIPGQCLIQSIGPGNKDLSPSDQYLKIFGKPGTEHSLQAGSTDG